MKRINQKRSVHIGVVCLSLMAGLAALAQLPQRNLTVQLRQVEDGGNSGYSVGTKPHEALLIEQMVNVRNGEKATFNVSKAMPVQWIQSVSVQGAALSTSDASASSAGAGVQHAVTWLQAGQSLRVLPRWPGGKQPASVEIDVQSASVVQRTGTELADQSQSQVATTASLPLGQWVTIASSGSSPQPGVYSSPSSSNNQRLLQIRVTAP